MKYKPAITLGAIYLLLTGPATAEDLESLFALDITELASIEYTVASTKPQSPIETPAIVSRYLMTDMASLGLRTLKDVPDFIPGFNLHNASIGTSTVMIRGITGTFNQKVLFLLDDVPTPPHAAIPLLGIPVSAIESVEVIRGPDAVIYGQDGEEH